MHKFACDMLPTPIYFQRKGSFVSIPFNLKLNNNIWLLSRLSIFNVYMFIKDYYGMIYKNPPKQKENRNSNILVPFMF